VQESIGRLQAAKSALDHENALFAYTKIVSPLNGVITQRFASDEAMIQAGTSSNNRYGEGLDTWQRAMPVMYAQMGEHLAEHGYLKSSQRPEAMPPLTHGRVRTDRGRRASAVCGETPPKD
jgi:hypothetical protein